MNAQEIIDYISNSEKKTPVKVYINTTAPVNFGTAKVFEREPSCIRPGPSLPRFCRKRERISEYVWKMTAATPGPALDLKISKPASKPAP